MAPPFPMPDNLSEDSALKFAAIQAKVSGGGASINYLLNELQNAFQEIDKGKASEQQPDPEILFARREAIEFTTQDKAARKERDEHMEQLSDLHDDLSQTLRFLETSNPEIDQQTMEHLAGIALSFGSLVSRIGLFQSSLDANAEELARIDAAETLAFKALGTILENKADNETSTERPKKSEGCDDCGCDPKNGKKRKCCVNDYEGGYRDGYQDFMKELEDDANPQDGLVGNLVELLQTLKERGPSIFGSVRTQEYFPQQRLQSKC